MYSDEISALARNRIHCINKETFLPAFKAAFSRAFTAENVFTGFRGAGLVPHNPEAVLSKVDVRLRTPTPPRQDNVAWEAKTPRNDREMEAQSTLIRNRMRKYRGSSASSADEKLDQLVKGAQQIAHRVALMEEEITRMRANQEALTKRKSRKRRYVRVEETLKARDIADLVAETESSGRGGGEMPAKRVRAERHC
jgi:uncharacterized small protein (DUF1192 family)